jgi:glyoxylase I family protein
MRDGAGSKVGEIEMPVKGLLSHLDISVGDPERTIPFYHVFLTALGFRRTEGFTSEFAGANPTRAGWRVETAGGATFGIEVRPCRPEDRDLRYDRYKPGPHHIAFHAESVEQVDQVHAAMLDAGAEVLDAPADYSGQPGYGAAFYADPDGLKLEVVYEPHSPSHARPTR